MNDNATYHLAELDRTRIVVPVVEKWVKAFKKRHEVEPDPEVEVKEANGDQEMDEDRFVDGSEEDE